MIPGLRVNTRSPNFSVTIDFAGLDTFSIAPGEWFDRGIVETYRLSNIPCRTAILPRRGPDRPPSYRGYRRLRAIDTI